MLVERNTSGHLWFCTSAFSSVPTASASSGRTFNQEPVRKRGREICPPVWRALALLCPCQPERRRATTPADAVAAVDAVASTMNTSTASNFTAANRDTRTSLPFLLQTPVGTAAARRDSRVLAQAG